MGLLKLPYPLQCPYTLDLLTGRGRSRLVIMVRQSMKTEFPSPDPVPVSQIEILDVPSPSHQDSPSPSEAINGQQDVEMTDIKDSQQMESVRVRGKLPSKASSTHVTC